MSSRNLIYTVRPALGGLDITSDPTIMDPNNLVTADNVTYLEGGQRKKRRGFLQYSPTSSSAGSTQYVIALTSGAATIKGLIDTWDYSTGLPAVQRYVLAGRRSIWRSTGDGLWTVINAGSSLGIAGAAVTLTLAQNHVVYSDISSNSGPPLAYNLNATTLVFPTTGANWPPFQSSVYHQQRLVMMGLSTAPSDIRMSAAGNIFDSTGVDTVTLAIDPGDGDQVIGASQTFFRNLYVFKGPQKGSIHEISGNTTTAYTKNKITSGVPPIHQNNIVTTPTDIYWISKFGVHSLQTTLKYGDVEQGFLSLPIQDLWRKRLINLNDLRQSMGFWDPTNNVVGWIVLPTGTLQRTWLIVYNYALSDPTPGGKKFWSIWKLNNYLGTVAGARSATVMLGSTGGSQAAYAGEPRLFLGGDDQGLVYQMYDSFDDDNFPYAMTITTPIITRFRTPEGVIPETQEKQFTGITTFYNTNDAGNQATISYTATVDNRDAGTGGFIGNLQGGVLGSFVLGSGLLGGTSFLYEESIIEGRGRGLQVTWSNALLDQDFTHLGYSVRFAAAESEAKEAV